MYQNMDRAILNFPFVTSLPVQNFCAKIETISLLTTSKMVKSSSLRAMWNLKHFADFKNKIRLVNEISNKKSMSPEIPVINLKCFGRNHNKWHDS